MRVTQKSPGIISRALIFFLVLYFFLLLIVHLKLLIF